jgi:hypothetical protein
LGELLTLHKWYMAAYAKTLLTFTTTFCPASLNLYKMSAAFGEHETESYKINQVAAYLKS